MSTQPHHDPEIQAMKDAVVAAKNARRIMHEQVRAGTHEYTFMEFRQLDLDIEKCEAEIRRST